MQDLSPWEQDLPQPASQEQRLRRSPPADPPIPLLLSPVSLSRRSPANTSPSHASITPVLATSDWGFLHSFLRNSPDRASAFPPSPLSGRRPGSGGLSRDVPSNSPLSPLWAWTNPYLHQSVDHDDGPAHRPHTPATVRPSSSALEPIIEGAPMEPDTSLGDTNAFVFDRYRFSTVSELEPQETSPRSSPARATHSQTVTARSSRASSRTEMSALGQTAGFRPKELVLTGTPRSTDARRASARLSRSVSVPLLTLQATQSDEAPQRERGERARSETAGSPASASACLTSDMTLASRPSSKPLLADSVEPLQAATSFREREVDAPQDLTGSNGSDELFESTPAYQGGPRHLSQPRSIPAGISVPQPATLGAVAVGEDGDSILSASSSLPAAATKHSQLSPPRHAAVTTPRPPDVTGHADAEADQSLRSDSLSPPRSASAGTPSSGTVELVPWQVATADAPVPRRSEEIFRPLSMALTMSRGPSSSNRSSVHVPPTPLKGGADFIWGRPTENTKETYGGAESSAAATRAGLGVTVPVARPGVELSSTAYESTREGSISSPPGGLRRLLLELEGSPHSHASSAVDVASGGVHAREGMQHQRSSTMCEMRAVPARSSSIRRRHHSADLDARRHGSAGASTVARIGLDAVPEHLVLTATASSPRLLERFSRSLRVRIALELFIVIYQAVFFALEAYYLWTKISPALPLVASALFLVLDTLILQMHLLPSARQTLYAWFMAVAAPTLAYCSALCALTLARLTMSLEHGTSTLVAHADRTRISSAALLAVGVAGMLISTALAVAQLRGRKRRKRGSGG